MASALTAPLLTDIFSTDDFLTLRSYLNDGYVTERHHSRLPYVIYNYTAKMGFLSEDKWDFVGKSCRGLIINKTNNEIVARPWLKFFSWTPQYSWTDDAPIEVTEKIDGSLGILYPDPSQPSGFAVATRGSFTSKQAIHATARYQETHRLFRPRPNFTYLFEIVYPENKIVVNYGRDDNLYLLGFVNNITGEYFSPKHPSIDIPRTRVFSFEKYGDFVKNFEHQNYGEGVVIRNLSNNKMMKWKRDEYVRLHRLLFGLNAAVVWENWKATCDSLSSESVNELTSWIENFDADVRDWIQNKIALISTNFNNISDQVYEDYDRIITTMGEDGYCDGLGDKVTRKAFAEYAVRSDYPHLLFMLWDDDKDRMRECIWKMVKPSGEEKPPGTNWESE